MAAGGDGTVAWILKTIHELRLEPAPQVAIMPLGTGNDLSLSFGWGNTFLQKWIDVSPSSKCSAVFCTDRWAALSIRPYLLPMKGWLLVLQDFQALLHESQAS